MKSAAYVAFCVLFATVIALTFTFSGCAPKKTGRGDTGGDENEVAEKPKTAIKYGTASIKGKVVYGAARPNYAPTKDILAKQDCANCKAPPGKEYWDADQKWIVGPEPEKGLANVVVRLKTPDNSYFETSEADKQKAAKEQVVLDQQCCNFDPHVLVVFPYFTDGKNITPTGQVLLIKNSGTMSHNTNFGGDSRLGNNENFKIDSGGERKYVLKPENDKPIPITCNVHQWMSATVFAYNHPYAMRTTESGEFELKNVNVGTTLTVEFWHEGSVVDTRPVTLSENEKKDLGTITVGK